MRVVHKFNVGSAFEILFSLRHFPISISILPPSAPWNRCTKRHRFRLESRELRLLEEKYVRAGKQGGGGVTGILSKVTRTPARENLKSKVKIPFKTKEEFAHLEEKRGAPGKKKRPRIPLLRKLK